jgi:RNA polymerase sigma-B factor
MSSDTSQPDTAGPREDLDEIAERYAHERSRLTGVPAQHLRERLIRDLLPFAGRLARRYRGSREPLPDLEQVARVGLVKAVDRYESGRGSFTAFAVATISGELKRYFRDSTWGVHVPRRLQNLALAVGQAEHELTAELGRRPTEHELAQRCGAEPAEINEARRSGAGYRPVSFSLPVGESGGELGDLFGSADHALDQVADQVTLRRLMEQLPARERRILVERFFGNRTQSEIAADLGVSQMHVSRLLSRTLEWLRTAMLGEQAPPWPAGTADVLEAVPVISVHRTRPGVTRVCVAGEVDRDNAQELRQALTETLRRCAAGARLEIDLAGVPLIDAAGFAVLHGAHEAARARGVTLAAVGVRPFVRRTAVAAGLGALLTPEASHRRHGSREDRAAGRQ